jgi:uncharacterized membrane protein
MIQIFGLMSFLGAFCFIGFGLSVANSIEANESKIAANIMTGLTVIGVLSFIIGMIGLFIVSLNAL